MKDTIAEGGAVVVVEGGGKKRTAWWMKSRFTWNKELLPIKIILFLFMGGTISYLPYLTLHMQQLGITVSEIAFIYAFLPIVSITGPPISGIIADKMGNYKLILALNMIIATILNLCLLLIPPKYIPSLTMDCGTDGHALSWAYCHPCHGDNHTDLTLILKNCRPECKESLVGEFTMCLYDQHNQPQCGTYNDTSQITINGSLSSWKENRDSPVDNSSNSTKSTCGHTWYGIVHDDHLYHNLTCPGDCRVECQVEEFPSCAHPDDPTNSTRTFWLYFVLRMASTFFLASSFTMIDATTLAVVSQHKAEFGKQRLLSTLGQATVPLLSGILVDWYSANLGYSDYAPTLYLGAALTFAAVLLLVTKLEVEVDISNNRILQDLRELVTKLEIDVFLVMIVVLGCNWGFIEAYLFVYLIELKAPNYLLGLTLTVGCLVGLPVLYIADTVIDKLGRPNIFIISFFAYGARHMGYAYMTDPWLVFPFELLELFTYQIMWVAAATYCPILAPKGMLATMMGLAGAIHYSVGRGVGSLLGGYLIASYGLSATFQIFACISFVGGVLYSGVHFLWFNARMEKKELKRRQKEKDANNKTSEEEEAMLQVDNQMAIMMSNSKSLVD